MASDVPRRTAREPTHLRSGVGFTPLHLCFAKQSETLGPGQALKVIDRFSHRDRVPLPECPSSNPRWPTSQREIGPLGSAVPTAIVDSCETLVVRFFWSSLFPGWAVSLTSQAQSRSTADRSPRLGAGRALHGGSGAS